MASHLSIDDVAKRTGLTAHTLRYYERIGLISPIARAAGGQRRYGPADIAWIEFLLRLRTTHMPISKMLAFAGLRSAGDSTISQRRHLLQTHLAEVQIELEAMNRCVAALQEKIEHYHSLEPRHSSTFNPEENLPDDHTKPLPARTGETP